MLALTLLVASGAQALTLQQVGSFDQPIYVTSDPGNAGRLFVVEREGGIKLVEGGVVSQFADLSSVVSCCSGERGLLSIALHPNFAANGRLFVHYTGEEEPGEIRIAELTAAPDRRTANISTLKQLLKIPHGTFATHNGGQLQFGPDGQLYASTGDGGGSNDPLHTAQNPASPLGKILQVNIGTPDTYTVWSSGLRNPYRFSFDSLSGAMVIGDVGQGLREEIDFAPSPFPGLGANYGWNCREGFLAGPGDDLPPGQCAATSFVDPVFDYPHSPDPDLGGAGRCAITGGYVARDTTLGPLYGRYVYADYCAGVLRSLQLPASAGGRATTDCSLGLRVKNPVSFGEDSARRLYVVEQGGGVYRLAGLPPANCPVVAPQTSVQAGALAGPTFIGIKAQRRRVERGKRALLTIWVSPCAGRKGDPVTLLRNGRRNGSRFLSRACTARFLPQVRRGTTFAAFTHEDRIDNYLAGKSRKLKIRIAHRQPVQRPR
jgi:hypothetical protein